MGDGNESKAEWKDGMRLSNRLDKGEYIQYSLTCVVYDVDWWVFLGVDLVV